MIRINDQYLAEKNKHRLHQAFEGAIGVSNLNILSERLVPIALCAGFTFILAHLANSGDISLRIIITDLN